MYLVSVGFQYVEKTPIYCHNNLFDFFPPILTALKLPTIWWTICKEINLHQITVTYTIGNFTVTTECKKNYIHNLSITRNSLDCVIYIEKESI